VILRFSKYAYVEHLKRAKAYEILGLGGVFLKIEIPAKTFREIKTGGG